MAKKEISSIESIVKSIENRFGNEAICKKQEGIKFLSTGSLTLDVALGGGWAKGRICSIYGLESSGKSSIALHTAAECQKEGKIVVYIDSEHALDEVYANSLGVDTSQKNGLWYLIQPSSGEEALEIGREFAKSTDVGLIVFDSDTSMIPKAIIEGEAGDQKMGLAARMFSSMIPTFVKPAMDSSCVVLFIGQMRQKIGVLYGDPWTTTGGNALKFYASQRVKIARSGQTKDGDVILANGTKCKVEKNKVFPPFRTAEFNIVFGKGIDKMQEIIDLSIQYDIIQKKGAGWMSYGEIKLGQGDNVVKQLLSDNPEMMQEIREKALKEITK